MGKTAKQEWAWLKQGRPERLEHRGVWPRMWVPGTAHGLGKPLEQPSEPVPAELAVRALRMVNCTGQWQSVLCRPAQLSGRRACPAAQPHRHLCLCGGTEGRPAGSHAEFCLRRSPRAGPLSGPLAAGFCVSVTRLEWVTQRASGCPGAPPRGPVRLPRSQGPGMTGAPFPRSCAFT